MAEGGSVDRHLTLPTHHHVPFWNTWVMTANSTILPHIIILMLFYRWDIESIVSMRQLFADGVTPSSNSTYFKVIASTAIL